MKRGKKMLLLLLALVLCAGGYYGMQVASEQSATVAEETGSFALDEHSADQLSGLAWTTGEETFAFTLADGAWTVDGNPAFPLNQEDVQNMADELLAVRGTRRLDGANDLSIYGLSEPAFTVTASWSDGASTAYAMGAETPFGDGYYVSSGQNEIVYTIEDDLAAIFDTTLNALAVKETIPSAAAANRLTVGSALDIVKEETSRTINAGEVWYDNLTGNAVDASKADELLSAAQGIAWAELAEPTASDAELTAFGLNEASAAAITLYEGENAVVTLLIGQQNDSGDYYARLPGSAMVYTVTGDDADALLAARAADMPSMVMLDLAEENVQSAVFTAGAHTYSWSPAEKSEEAEEAEETADAQEDPGKALWASLLAMEPANVAESADGSVLLSVEVLSTDGQSAVLTFTEYDAENYAVQVLDRCFLTDAAKVDALIRSLRAIP